MVTDPIGDMLIQIKNATMAGGRVVDLPCSKMKVAVAEILVSNGYLAHAEKIGELPKLMLRLTIAYDGKTPILTGVKRISKPGMRWYVAKSEVPRVMGGMGMAIVSTPQGVMTGDDARKKGVGGELLCEVW